MPHHADVDLILGTDFLIPSVIRLDLYNARTKLPDGIEISLREPSKYGDTFWRRNELMDGPSDTLQIKGNTFLEIKLQHQQPSKATHELWARRLPTVLPTIIYNKNGNGTKVRLTNVSSDVAVCPAHFPII